MSSAAHNSSQWGMPSDPNPSEQFAGPSRRHSGVGRKESIGPSRSHDISAGAGADSPDLRIIQTLDPVNAKLDLILAGFSQLESRIDATDRRVQILEPSHKPEPDPTYDPELKEIDPDPPHRQWQHRYSTSHFSGDSNCHPRTGFPHRFHENAYPRLTNDTAYSSGTRYRHDQNLRPHNSQSRQFSDFPNERLRERSCWEPPNSCHQPFRSWETDHQRPMTCGVRHLHETISDIHNRTIIPKSKWILFTLMAPMHKIGFLVFNIILTTL